MLDDAKIESFVRTNGSYYREKWRDFQAKPGQVASFNFAAGFGQIIWLAYRKLYVPLFWVVVLCLVEVSITLYFADNQLISSSLITAWNGFAVFLYFAVIGTFGNYWYWKKYQRIEAQAKAQSTDREVQRQFVLSNGGTNSMVVWLLVIAMLAPMTWVFYQTKRPLPTNADGTPIEFIFDATGPLTLAEVRTNFIDRIDEPFSDEREECVLREVKERALSATP